MVDEQAIQKHLDEYPDKHFTVMQLAMTYESSPNTVRTLIKGLLEGGMVQKVGHGKFASLNYTGPIKPVKPRAKPGRKPAAAAPATDLVSKYKIAAINKTWKISPDIVQSALQLEDTIVDVGFERNEDGNITMFFVKTSRLIGEKPGEGA